MRSPGHFHRLTIGLTCLALITPRPCVADELSREPSRQIFQATDIKLTADGRFDGQIVDSLGHGAPATEVQLWSDGKLAARCVADQEGRFQFPGLRAGVYQLLAPGTGRVVRLWQPAAAPPAAQSALLLVQGPVVRGQ
jgi:hypothetical protein